MGEPFPLSSGGTVVMVGDSVSTQHLHTNYIEAYVRTRFPQEHFTFHNVSHSGHTVEQALARFEEDVVEHHPTVVTVDLGKNDAALGEEAVPGYVACMQELIDRIRDLGAAPALIGPSPVNDNSTTGDMTPVGALLSLMSYELVALGERCGVPVADQFHALVDIWGHNYLAANRVDLGGNPVHPGAAGAPDEGVGVPARAGSTVAGVGGPHQPDAAAGDDG